MQPHFEFRGERNGASAMPAFGTAFSDAQIRAIVGYIRNLKPEGS